MKEVVIYDVEGKSWNAILNQVPEIEIKSDFSDDFPNFSFQTKIVTTNKVIFWLLNGEFHRLDGPAIEYPNGGRQWFIFNRELT